jgi:site-specific recombinase XerC/soluble cytochrome b562
LIEPNTSFIESPHVNTVLEDLSENSQQNYLSSLRQFLRFLNSREDLKKEITIEEVIEEAKTDVKKTQEKMDQFYLWLQNKKVKGYSQRKKGMKESSANQRAYGYLRGFFANLDITFERKWAKRIPKVKRPKQAIKKDNVYTFYDVDEKTKTIHFNRELMQEFLANLKLRDVAITLALLSSSQDSGDLLNLNVGEICEQNDKSRIFWEGTRNKTGVSFRTFLSKEATRFVRKYLDQERGNAKATDPLFVYTRYLKKKQPNGSVKRVPVEKRVTPGNLASIYRDVARKMGIKWGNGEYNPLRPKRMCHLFRTACDTAGIPELYTNAFMGHRNHMGQEYSELSKAKLELEYLRVEPFLTVYGQSKENLEIKEDLRKMETRIIDLNKEIAEQKSKNVELTKRVQLLSETLHPFIENIDKFEEVFQRIREGKEKKLIAEINEAEQAEREKQVDILDRERKCKK